MPNRCANPYEEGRQAQREGRSRKDNPYSYEFWPECHGKWADGFQDESNYKFASECYDRQQRAYG